jgi:hypothetical protein
MGLVSRGGLLLLLALLLAAAPAGAFRRAGTAGAQFLKLSLDARAAGLAGATAALPGAQRSGWCGAGNLGVNPAGLAGCLERSFCLSQERRFAGIRHGLLQLSRPLSEKSALALGLNWLQAPDQEITTLEQPEGTGATYHYGDFALGASLATRLTDRLSVGGTLRWIRQDLHRERAQGPALDLGLLLETGWRDLRLGLAAANFGPRLRLEGEDLLVLSEDGRPAFLEAQEFQLPLVFRAALADRLWSRDGQRLDAALQAEHPNDSRQNLRLGLEYAWRERLLLRAGRHFRRDLEQAALGLGLALPLGEGRTLRLDYAWTGQQRLAATQLLSASLTW